MINKDRLQMYVSLTKITIVLCWVSLFSFWAIKLFGGNWFEIMVENENFVKFSNTVQNTWLIYLSTLITTIIANHFTFCSISEKFALKGKELIFVIFATITSWVTVNFINIEILKMWYGYIIIIIYAIIFQKSWKKLYGILALILETVFLAISMITRNVELQYVDNLMMTYILSIDFYIMYAIYYLHLNLIRIKKEI